MKFLCCIFILFCSSVFVNAQKEGHSSTVYRSSTGDEVKLTALDDSSMHALFINHLGEKFDTTMDCFYHFKLKTIHDDLPFLVFPGDHWGGIELFNDSLRFREFSSRLYMDQFVKFDKMYRQTFIRQYPR